MHKRPQMSRKANENNAFERSSCRWNHCLNKSFLGFLLLLVSCATDPLPNPQNSENQPQAVPVAASVGSSAAPSGPSGQVVVQRSTNSSSPATDTAESPQFFDVPIKAGDALAEPISPATVARFPHLAPFQGLVLLGGSRMQVVLAGVSTSGLASLGADELWQPGVIAFVERRHDGSGW